MYINAMCYVVFNAKAADSLSDVNTLEELLWERYFRHI